MRIFSDDMNALVVEREGAREGEWEAGEGEVEMSDGEEVEEGAEEEVMA